jgi:predicted glycosyltransferase involved in capsule biosynthesis
MPAAIKNQTVFVLIDDASPNPISRPDVDLNLTMARILQDIPWNQPGARNLGAYLADTEYLFFTDIDHEITVDALQKSIETIKDPNTIYRFKRIVNGRLLYPHPCSFVISKQAFERIGGFDEDFSGHRGHDDTMFRMMSERHLKIDMIDGVLNMHEDGLTTGLDRDHSRNTLLFQIKKQEVVKGRYRNGRRLRFDWEIVYQFRR